MRRALLLFALCIAAMPGRAQAPAAPLLKAADLQADAAVLRSAYEQLHPGLYRYRTKAEMDADFGTLQRDLNPDQSLQSAFLAFSVFAAKVKCGHTQANPFNQPDSVVNALFKSPTRLPFYFDWLDRHMIVTRDFTPEHALPAGTEILSIRGVPAPAILAKLMTIARADGSNDSKRIAQLGVNGDSKYETFDIYYPLFYPSADGKVALTVRKPGNGSKAGVMVSELTYEQRIAPIQAREAQSNGGDGPLFDWSYLPDGSAYLKMPDWALYNSKWDWKRWLKAHLDEAVERKSPALILDIRGNEGGDDVGNEILPYLIDKPLPLSQMRRLVRYRKVPDDLAPYLHTWDKSFRDWGSAAVALSTPWPTAPAEVPYYRLVRYDDDAASGGDVIQPAGKRFPGKVFVLVDAVNSSATFQFAENIQSHRLGTLIGQPTGGSQRGINGGAFFFVALPHSHIEMDLPLIGTFPPTPAPDAGVTPDIVVTQTVQDIASGRDPVMAAVASALHR